MSGEAGIRFSTPEKPRTIEAFRRGVARIVGMLAISGVAVACGEKGIEPHANAMIPNDQAEALVIQPTEPEIQINGEVSIMPHIADPAVLKLEDGSFVFSGTKESDTDVLPLYRSDNLVDYTKIDEYNPSLLDPENDYCRLWAPDIAAMGNDKYQMFFTARQIGEGQDCEDSGNGQAIFLAQADDETMNFGPPQAVRIGANAPHTFVPKHCPPSGCENALRIDPEIAIAKNGHRWMFYNWFAGGGNRISSVNIDDPSQRNTVAIPTNGEGNINEAPEIFQRNGKFYMLYSHNFFDKDYGMKYISSDTIAGLSRANEPAYEIASATRGENGLLESNIGHPAVVENDGKYYLFYHKGSFDENGKMNDRSTYMQEIKFDGDSILPLDHVNRR